MIYRWITWIILYLWWLSSFSLWHLNQVQGCWKEAELSQGHTCKVKSLGVGCLCVCVCVRQRDTEKDRDRFNSQVKLQSAFFFLKKRIFCCVLVCAKLLQLCPTLCDPMDCSRPGSSVHGILHGRIRECCHALLQGDSFAEVDKKKTNKT